MKIYQYSAFFILGVFLDQLTKYLAFSQLSYYKPIPFFLGIKWQLVLNSGAAYGIFEQQRFFLLLVSLLVLLWGLIYLGSCEYSFLSNIAMSILMIGAMGNFIDRFFRGAVIDFIDIHILPVFNVADIFITTAVFLFFIEMLCDSYKEKK